MRTERVFLNYRCNQNCSYCTFRRATDDLRAIQFTAVRDAIDRAIAGETQEIVFTGGEPTLRPDLPRLVAHATGRAVRVVLATNATLVTDELARSLGDAGLTKAVVNLAGFGDTLDHITRDPGGFDRAIRGIAALAKAGVEIELEAAVVRSTAPLLPSLPAHAKELGAAGLILHVPTESPDPAELLAWDVACETVKRIERSARRAGIPVRFAPEAAPPPCAFPPNSRVEHLYGSIGSTPAGRSHGRPDHRHVAECGACLVRDGCPGVAESYLARWPTPKIHPVQEDRVRRRLTLLSTVTDQVRRELVTTSHGPVMESVIRIQFQCNQSCTFCYVSTHLPAPADEAIRSAIHDAARRNTKIVLSGGEPTLNSRLPEWVRLAKSLSTFPVQIQTNAIQLADGPLLGRLVEGGLDEAFVSLHGATADVSDRVTEAPGTFVRTLAGIDELAKTNVLVILNFVLCATNHREAPALIELVAARWPNAIVNLSFVAPSSDLVPRTPELIPRYSDVLPDLARAIDLANDRGVSIVGLESMCGLPLCLIPASARDLAPTEIPEGIDAGEFVKGEACRTCAKTSYCYGLRRGYRAMYGESELRPFAP
jgi:MoaA/NifB/PqqE/SkfB family radical SAM enzyme